MNLSLVDHIGALLVVMGNLELDDVGVSLADDSDQKVREDHRHDEEANDPEEPREHHQSEGPAVGVSVGYLQVQTLEDVEHRELTHRATKCVHDVAKQRRRPSIWRRVDVADVITLREDESKYDEHQHQIQDLLHHINEHDDQEV